MSASSKKKLRKEQEAVKMTERQLTAQKEAKKTRLYTIAFASVMVVLLVIAIWVGVSQTITSSGIREKNTVAVTVGEHELSNAELNYYYIDAVNNFYSQYGSYASLLGMDVTKPLNEQVTNEETGATWADDFLTTAKDTAASTYALVDAAEAAGFTLTEDQLGSIAATINNLNAYAAIYGYADGESYLKAMYGNGATLESYEEYAKLNTLASAYNTHYSQSLTYTDADLREKDAQNANAYSSFSFNTYYVSASKFLEGGTTAEDGTVSYTDEEKAASVAAAEAAAQSLTSGEITSVEALDAAIAALPINEGSTASSTAYENTLYSNISTIYSDWVTDSSRKAGDVTVIKNATTDESGTETINGYYVVYFLGSDDNTGALKNVRHILISYQGGTTDSTTGTTVYSDEEKAAAKAEAEAILADWMAGEATEDSFAALANEKSADGDGTTGGLYENVYPGQMVVNFNDWCFAEGRKSGDTGIVESNYGYHVMYFVSDSEQNYRDYMIEQDLRNADTQSWYTALIDSITVTDGNTKYLPKDLVLDSSSHEGHDH